MSLDREALSRAVAEISFLSLENVENLFGGQVTAENKAVVWRFLSMTEMQQHSIWQVYIRIKHLAPDIKVEAVRCIPTTHS